MSDLEKCVKLVKDFQKERDWEKFNTPKDVALSLVLESAEVLEHFQWRNGEELEQYLIEHKIELGDEIADVFSYLLILCDRLGIDLVEAHADKMRKTALKYPIEKSKGNNKKYTEL